MDATINLKTAANTTQFDKDSFSLHEVFTDTISTYINVFKLFIAHFNSIPNFITEINIDCKKANHWFAENYNVDIKHMFFNKRYFNGKKRAEYDDIFYILSDDPIVYFNTNQSTVEFLFRKTEMLTIEKIINGIKKFKKRPPNEKADLYLLVNGYKLSRQNQ